MFLFSPYFNTSCNNKFLKKTCVDKHGKRFPLVYVSCRTLKEFKNFVVPDGYKLVGYTDEKGGQIIIRRMEVCDNESK